MFRTTRVFAVLVMLLLAQVARAVDAPPASSEPEPEPKLIHWYWGAHLGAPYRVAGSTSVIFDVDRKGPSYEIVGPSVRLEVGAGGAAVGIGYTRLSTPYGVADSSRVVFMRAMDLAASPVNVLPNTNLVGAEYTLMGFGISVSAGVYTPVSGPETSDWVIGWGVGFGI